MVVKSAPTSPSDSSDPLRGVQRLVATASTAVSSSSSSTKSTDLEFGRLKSLVPAVSRKQSVSKLDVILEAIRYIDQLQEQLLQTAVVDGKSAVATMLVAGKENATLGLDRSLMRELQRRRQRQRRRRSE